MRVYGPSLGKDNKGLWVELGAIRGLWNNPWCIEGDFNIIKSLGKHSRVNIYLLPLEVFHKSLRTFS